MTWFAINCEFYLQFPKLKIYFERIAEENILKLFCHQFATIQFCWTSPKKKSNVLFYIPRELWKFVNTRWQKCVWNYRTSVDITKGCCSFNLGLQGSHVFLEEFNCLIKWVCFFKWWIHTTPYFYILLLKSWPSTNRTEDLYLLATRSCLLFSLIALLQFITMALRNTTSKLFYHL